MLQAGTSLPPTERSDRGNTSAGHRTSVLQPLLSCSKNGWRPETHSGSAVSEFFHLQREVQDADDENHHVSDSRRGLVCHYRPKECIHSHPGRSALLSCWFVIEPGGAAFLAWRVWYIVPKA